MSGCVTEPQIKFVPLTTSVQIPDYLKTCKGLPNVPTGPYKEKEVAKFIVNLGAAHQDCADRLRAVIDLINKQNANSAKLKVVAP